MSCQSLLAVPPGSKNPCVGLALAAILARGAFCSGGIEHLLGDTFGLIFARFDDCFVAFHFGLR